MGKERGFLEFGRKDPGYRPVEQRLNDWRAVERTLSEVDVREQAARCMDCGTPFCHGYGCPVRNVIPEMNDLVCRGRWAEALAVVLATNPFPEFTGRICPAPCEAACVLGIHAPAVTIRQVELAIIERGFAEGWMRPRPPDSRREGSVAVMGSGPSGLAAAEALNRAGYAVTVFENERRAGGILRYGIPDFKLEKSVVDRRVDLMRAEGVRFETGVEIGRDLSHRFLRDRFQAILLTGGSREPRELNVPGRELQGVHFAMPYLVQQNRRVSGEPLGSETPILATGKRVAVLGGGDTGSDCVGTALRQGAAEVHQFEILPKPPPERSARTPWPLWPDMLRSSSSHQEGGRRRWSVHTRAFLGEQGRLRALRCVEVEWARDEAGRPAMRERPGTDFEQPAELALLCLGFVGPGTNRLVEDLGIERDARGNLRVDSCGMTSVEGVFSAGDMARGQSLVVRAIADGLKAAAGVERWLKGRSG